MSRNIELARLVREAANRARNCPRHRVALDPNGRFCTLCVAESKGFSMTPIYEIMAGGTW